VKHARNIAIIALIALAVDLIPGGGKGANSFQQLLYLLFLGTLGWFVAILYRQHRTSLDSLGDRRRAILYVSIGALVLVVSALWRVSGVSAVVALVVAGAAIYAIVMIVVSARQY
jgi:hypothetical protein